MVRSLADRTFQLRSLLAKPTSDPYVKVILDDSPTEIFKTDTVVMNCDPEWHQTCTVPLTCPNHYIRFQVVRRLRELARLSFV